MHMDQITGNFETVTFDAYAMMGIVLTAERRGCGKRPNKVPNRRVDKSTDFTLDLHGVMGEKAVARYFGVQIDMSIKLEGDGGVYDLQCFGKTIQVKTNMNRNHPRKYLYFDMLTKFKADFAVCCLLKSANQIDIAGWIERQKFMDTYEKLSWQHGPVFAVNVIELRPIKELMQKLMDS